jgi:peptide/nickel transport system ATP-binding protein
MCDRLAIMYMGKIVEKGPTDQVIEDPQHPYTRALIDAVPVPDPDVGRERVELQGEVGDVIDVPSGCRFKDRCPSYIGDVCDQVVPPLEAKREFEQAVACHLYESAEGYDPYAEMDGPRASGTADSAESTPADD